MTQTDEAIRSTLERVKHTLTARTFVDGGKSFGSMAHWHPVAAMDRIASQTARRWVVRGRPTLLRAGMKGASTAHSLSALSLAVACVTQAIAGIVFPSDFAPRHGILQGIATRENNNPLKSLDLVFGWALRHDARAPISANATPRMRSTQVKRPDQTGESDRNLRAAFIEPA